MSKYVCDDCGELDEVVPEGAGKCPNCGKEALEMTDRPTRPEVKFYYVCNDSGTWTATMQESKGGAWVKRCDYDALEAENRELRERIENWKPEYMRVCHKVTVFAGALRFYADPETYFAIGFLPDPPCGEFWDDFEEIDKVLGWKPGKRARAALADSGEQTDA